MERGLCALLFGFILLQLADAAARFTKHPEEKLYIVKGQTAKLTWDYQVDNIDKEFDSQSPRWYFHNYSYMIGYGDGFDGWKFKISLKTCPLRLLTPTVRVSAEGRATLVITNVTRADSGTYVCTLFLLSGSISSMPSSKAKLIVTEIPSFIKKPNATTITIEHMDLNMNCSAVGQPTPNVTWLHVQQFSKVPIIRGIGTAVLSLTNIQRNQSGTYECHASNNPNEKLVRARTLLIVNYKPTILKPLSPAKISSWSGSTITLRCNLSSSLPSPTWTWYKPNGNRITNVRNITNGSEVTVLTEESGDYGIYICRAANIAGSDSININVLQLFPPGSPSFNVTDIEASSAVVRWAEPVDNGGSKLTEYKVEINSKTYIIASWKHKHFTIPGLTKNKIYVVKLYAKNAAGYGNASSKTFTTKKEGPPGPPVLKIIRVSPTTVILSWSKPEENGGEIEYYTIYKRLAGDDDWLQVGTLSGDPLTYTVKDLLPGKTYSFHVTAKNKDGSSLMDVNRITVTLPVETTTPHPSTSAIASTSRSGSRLHPCEECNCSTKVAVLAAILALSVLVIILLVVFIAWKLRTNKPKNDNKEEAVYYNAHALGMTSLPKTVNQSSARTRDPNQEHYQQLNPCTLQSPADAVPTYEPVRSVGASERNDQHTYQALRNHPSVYQSLQTYANVTTA
ncbi:neogenin isoform X1 [Exaiptasia diaphana]|uniref:Uncharacterized protein n=1 Tax=Exaiptasia diaphana TaxID=2652724 RepID=A0A913Y0K1_EXADI|nr:neogenin isoform X1 [Exaiptasia diaphana]